MRRFGLAAIVGISCAVAPGGATAQSLLGTRVRADNDAFNFWEAPWFRPDEEYTSGVRAELTYAGASWWGSWLHGSAPPCASGAARCASHSYAFGQDIYTAARQAGDTAFAPGSRPNAGWLYLEESSRVASQRNLFESSIAFGVTGPPALAQYVQTIAHGYAAAYNRPIDWSRQLPAEPGIILHYQVTHRLAVGTESGWAGDLEPHAGASLGTILTEATAGVRARLGFGMGHPWLLGPEGPAAAVSLFADATMHAVARNEFLAGTFFQHSDHVQERPFVPEYQAGFTLRWRRLSGTYRADLLGSEYFSRGRSHTWGSVEAGWRVVP